MTRRVKELTPSQEMNDWTTRVPNHQTTKTDMKPSSASCTQLWLATGVSGADAPLTEMVDSHRQVCYFCIYFYFIIGDAEALR
jgi:hypothetical protein